MTCSVCVYCGSRPGADPEFAAIAQAVGTWIGQRGGQLVYGGGKAGLMGVVANATLAAGGRVIGIIPQALVDREQAHHGCTELHIVADMHERKALMAEHARSFLALPGGIGTFEELFEAWTWRQLAYHDKPIGILNAKDFYTPLQQFLSHVTEQGFMSDWQQSLVHWGDQPEALLAQITGLTASV